MSGSKKAASLLSALILVTAVSSRAVAEDAPTGQDDTILSRLTLAIPFFSRHYPHDRDFNDQNWGAVLFYALDDQFSVAGGDFTNSYSRNTAFAGVSWTPYTVHLSSVQIGLGGIIGLDLNGGYRGHNGLDPLLAAGTIKFSGNYFEEPDYQFLNRFGLLMTVIPGIGASTSTAFNLALTVRL